MRQEIRVHHAYKDGYSVLPRLKRIDAGCVFDHELVDRSAILAAKREVSRLRQCYLEAEMSDATHDEICRFLVDRYPVALEPPYALANLGLQTQDDFAVVRLCDGRDWVAALHVSLPSHWSPERVIGKSFAATHTVVPGMKLASSAQMVEAMIHSGPFERYAWGVQFDSRLDGHPERPAARFNSSDPKVYVRVERQVTVGFPAHGAALFLIQPHLFGEDEVDRLALLEGLRQMTPEQRRYKAVADCFDALCAHLLGED